MSAVERAARVLVRDWLGYDDVPTVDEIVNALADAGLLVTPKHDRVIKAETLRWAAEEAAHLGTVSGSQVHVGDRAAAMLHRLADDIEADHE